MRLIDKDINSIHLQDIEYLRDEEIREQRFIEYKEELSLTGDNKKKFLEQVCSFANSGGGDIVFGVKEKRDKEGKSLGLIEEIKGISIDNYDDLRGKIENIVRDRIKPRIRIDLPDKQIQLDNGKSILIVRIPQSWNPPHAIWWNDVARFYARNSFGKYPLDIEEIRNAFIGSETVRERIRQFRFDRIEKILNGEAPVRILGATKDTMFGESENKYILAMLHILPIISFTSSNEWDLKRIDEYEKLHEVFMWNREFGDLSRGTFDFDGIYYSRLYNKQLVSAYVYFLRIGVIEIAYSLYNHEIKEKEDYRITKFNPYLNNLVDRTFNLREIIPIETPLFITLSILNCKGHTMLQNNWDDRNLNKIKKDHLHFQEILIQDFDKPAEDILKPYYERLWQSVGSNYVPDDWLKTD